jgi:hypothetical protein
MDPFGKAAALKQNSNARHLTADALVALVARFPFLSSGAGCPINE